MERVYLSRRNLLVLLKKLDRNQLTGTKDSACTLLKIREAGDEAQQEPYRQTMKAVAVTAVEDGEYYGARIPTPVLPEDEPK